jgi:hypothetical protein
MITFKKIVAAIFMILSVIVVVVLIIALFGSWVVRGRLETISVNLLLAGENVIAATQEGLDRVDEILDTSHDTVTEIDSAVRDVGAGIRESDPIFVQFLDSRGIDLKMGIENAASAFIQLEANIIAINDAIDAIREVPLLNVDSRLPEETKLQEVEDRMAQVREDIVAFTEEVQSNRSDIIEGKVEAVTGITTGISDGLDSTRTDLQEADARLTESAQSMAELRERIPGIYTLITIILNLLILLTILAFISLFLHAWGYFKCTEQGLSGLMPGDCEKVPAVS